MFTVVREVQPKNAQSGIFVNPAGSDTVFNAVQSIKAQFPIDVPVGIVMEVKAVHPSKALTPMVTPEEKVTVFSE